MVVVVVFISPQASAGDIDKCFSSVPWRQLAVHAVVCGCESRSRANKHGFRPPETQIELMLFLMANNTIKTNNLQPVVELHHDGSSNLYQRKLTFLKLCAVVVPDILFWLALLFSV